MKEILATSVMCKAQFQSDNIDTTEGWDRAIPATKQFRITATIEFVSNGDFSEFESKDPNKQEDFNRRLSALISEKIIKNPIVL